MIHRHDLTDEQWNRLRPLLPPQKPSTGRPAHNHRQILNGILWWHRTGAPWRNIPAAYGKWSTIACRFYRWTQSGLWMRILHALQREADARHEVDWSAHFVDGTIIRAHQHAAGACRKKGDQSSKR